MTMPSDSMTMKSHKEVTAMTLKNFMTKLHLTCSFLVLLLFSQLAIHSHAATNESEWVGKLFTYSTIGEAKRHALENDRPLLVIVGMKVCEACDSFDDRILKTTDFLNFAKTNKLVLCEVRESTSDLILRVKKDYKSIVTFGSTPFVFLFKVKSNATFVNSNAAALAPEQVDLLYQTSSKFYCGGSYMSGAEWVPGISNGANSKWSSSTFKTQLYACFPNNGWKTINSSSTPDPDPDPDDPDPDDPDPDDPDPEPTGDEAKWVGKLFTYSTIGDAKKYAYNNNRPLLVVVGMKVCEACDAFDKTIMKDGTDFRTYAKNNKFVLCEVRESTSDLILRVKKDYKSLVTFGSTPFVFLFKVKSGATFVNSNAAALDPAQVDLLYQSTSKFYCGGSYMSGDEWIPGIPNGTNSNWSSATFIKQIKACVPNQGWTKWDPPVPEDPIPSGWESAIDLGVIPNESNPAYGNGWVVASDTQTLSGKTPAKWFKFTGSPNRRYYFYADVCSVSSGTNYSMTATLYGFNGTKPTVTTITPFNSTNLTNFNRGFYFDLPSATSSQVVYYLYISATGGTTSSTSSFKLKVHETDAAPASGTLTNPAASNATVGKWTIDTDAVLSAAASSGKPVLAYFTGITWCPWCAGMEHTIFNKQAFKDKIKNYYLLEFDNRRRDGTGPSIFTDDLGYLKTNSNVNAESKLQSNREWQEKLSLPNATPREGWPNGSIGYPTMVFCRVVAETRTTYTLEPIGRFDESFTLDEIIAALSDFETLMSIGYKEFSGNMDTSTESLDGLSSVSFPLGGRATQYWTKFTPADNLSWNFTLKSTAASAGATAIIQVYSADGTLLLESTAGSLKDGINLLFTPETIGESLWLCVVPSDQANAVVCALEYDKFLIQSSISLDKEVIVVSRNSASVNVPMTLTLLEDTDEPSEFEYRIVTADVSPAPASYFAGCDWTSFIWDDFDQLQTDIAVAINVPTSVAEWTGTKDFKVQLRQKANATCIVGDISETTVQIASKPLFAPRPSSTTFTMYKGLYSTIDIPVCPTNGMKTNIASLKPTAGLTFVDNTSSDSPRITLAGKPTATGTKSYTLTLQDSKGVQSDTLTIKVTVADMPSPAINIGTFTAALYRTDSPFVYGTLILKRTQSALNVTISTFESAPMQIALKDWSGYDAATNTLYLNHSFDSKNVLDIAVTNNGIGNVTFITDNAIYEGDIYPITSTPAEYDGLYNIAVRPDDDNEGFSIGWMQATIANGKAEITLNLYDESQPISCTGYIYDEGNFGYIPFFMPLGDSATGNYHALLSGLLAIVPSSKRSPTEVDAWISGCGSVYIASNGDIMYISPCGTLFDPSKSISDCIDSDYYFFFAEAPSGTIVPNSIQIAVDADGNGFSPVKSNGFMSSFLGKLSIDRTKGTFSMPLNVLKPNSSSVVTATPVIANGIIVPTTTPCCSLPDNIAIAYGCYEYNGQTYVIRIMPYQFSQLAKPTVNVKSSTTTNMVLSYSSGTKSVLFMDMRTETLYYKQWSSNQTQSITLDCKTLWRFTSINKANSTAMTCESEPVDILPVHGKSTYTYGIGSGCNVTLKLGWNLVGIPYDLAIPESQALPDTIATFDQTLRTTVKPSSLKPGHAYWFFIKDDSTQLKFEATKLKSAAQIDIAPGWALMAYPGQSTAQTMFRFSDDKFLQVQPEDSLDEYSGVWLYKEAE